MDPAAVRSLLAASLDPDADNRRRAELQLKQVRVALPMPTRCHPASPSRLSLPPSAPRSARRASRLPASLSIVVASTVWGLWFVGLLVVACPLSLLPDCLPPASTPRPLRRLHASQSAILTKHLLASRSRSTPVFSIVCSTSSRPSRMPASASPVCRHPPSFTPPTRPPVPPSQRL